MEPVQVHFGPFFAFAIDEILPILATISFVPTKQEFFCQLSLSLMHIQRLQAEKKGDI